LADLQQKGARPVLVVDVLSGSFPIDALPSGSYYLHLVLLNDANESLAEQSRKFFVLNPSLVVAEEQSAIAFETSEYAVMPEGELERALEHVQIIATENERHRLRRIQDVVDRRRFLMEFWLARDPQPSTPANEYKEDFYTLLRHANERYSIRGVEGWQSDRGRVLIKYGQPARTESRLYDAHAKPHEIWTYNSIPGEGNAVFIFADIDGYGVLKLIHSTVSGERQLVNWQKEVLNTCF